ncbi:hypothetical protein ACNKHN_10470 [Shigella flexneri]
MGLADSGHCDLFEGLVNQNEKGEIVPALLLSGKVMTTVSGLYPRHNENRADGTPVTAQHFSSTAGNAWWTRKRFRHLHGLRRWRESTNPQAIIDGKACAVMSWRHPNDAHTLKIQLDKPLPWFADLNR